MHDSLSPAVSYGEDEPLFINPALFEGVALRRIFAYGIDVLLIAMLGGIVALNVELDAEAAEAMDLTLANMRFIRPLDESLILDLAREHDALVTLEDNAVAGGAGSAVAECLNAAGIQMPLLHLGLPDSYLEHAGREELLAEVGLDAAGIEALERATGFDLTARPERFSPAEFVVLAGALEESEVRTSSVV